VVQEPSQAQTTQMEGQQQYRKVSPASLGGSIRPYALTDHIHEREAGRHLSNLLVEPSSPLKVAFIPSVAPWFSGILSTLSMPLSERLSAKDLKALYEEKYEGEKLITIKRDVPSLQDVENKHGWTVGGFQVHSDGDRAVVVVRVLLVVLLLSELSDFDDCWQGGLDNLLKGAATQCLQVSYYSKNLSSLWVDL